MDRMTTTYHHDHDAKLGQFAKSGGGINNGLIILGTALICAMYKHTVNYFFPPYICIYVRYVLYGPYTYEFESELC